MASWILLLVAANIFLGVADSKKVRIPDNLDDVVDSEEDDAWKSWGKKKSVPVFDPPPDFSNMSPHEIQQEMLKRQMGPSIGFVKLRLDVPRTKDEMPVLAKKWTQLLRTGGIDAKMTAVDINTLMFTINHGQDTTQVKDFILGQPEAYEFKLGQQVYRRPGDPPLEVVIEKRQKDAEAETGTSFHKKKDEL